MEWPFETVAPAAVAGARAEQPGIAEVRVAQPGVAEVLAEQPDERLKSIADQPVQCSKASPAAVPDETSCAASSLPGGNNTPKGFQQVLYKACNGKFTTARLSRRGLKML